MNIKCSAIKTSKGKIYIGKRHCDCLKACFDSGDAHGREIQGFMTSDDEFVNRMEARKIAEEAGQLLDRASNGNILYSEDII